MTAIHRLVDLYCALAKFMAVVCMVVMVVLVFGNVVLRYGFNSGITVSEELSRWCLVWLTFFGAVVALRQHKHLGMDSVVKKLPPVGRRLCLIASQCLMLWMSFLLLDGSWRQMLITLGDTAPASGFSVGMVYASGVFFGISALVIIALDLAHVLGGRAREDELIAVRESEEA